MNEKEELVPVKTCDCGCSMTRTSDGWHCPECGKNEEDE